MDYDSGEEGEEDEGDEEGGNNGNDEEELDEAEGKATGALDESKDRKARSSQVDIQNHDLDQDLQQNQSRVNTVLQSNTAMESYRYDVEHELWCEVSARRSSCHRHQVVIVSLEPVNVSTPEPQLDTTVGSCVFSAPTTSHNPNVTMKGGDGNI